MGLRQALIAVLVMGCGPAAEPAVAEYFGEVHVHQYESGAHVEATFLSSAVDASLAGRDTILAPAIPASYAQDDCAVVLSPRCPGPCASGQFCAGETCAPLVEQRFADGGEVRVRGGKETAAVDLRYQEFIGYQVVSNLERGAQVFVGGETLAIEGTGGSSPAFEGTVSAPRAMEPTDASTSDVRWAPASGNTFVKLTYTITSQSGEYAVVSCFAEDARGTWTMPSEVTARLPPKPRSLQLEISRNTLHPARARGNVTQAVLLHTSDVKLLGWEE